LVEIAYCTTYTIKKNMKTVIDASKEVGLEINLENSKYMLLSHRQNIGLYGCETWYLTLRKEHRLRVFENKVLRRIFGPKGDEVTGG
jgi:hypothetical protein